MNINLVFLGEMKPKLFKVNTDERDVQFCPSLKNVRLPRMIILLQDTIREACGVPIPDVQVSKIEFERDYLYACGGVDKRCLRWQIEWERVVDDVG